MSSITYTEIAFRRDIFGSPYGLEELLQWPIMLSVYIWACEYCINIDLKKNVLNQFSQLASAWGDFCQSFGYFTWEFSNNGIGFWCKMMLWCDDVVNNIWMFFLTSNFVSYLFMTYRKILQCETKFSDALILSCPMNMPSCFSSLHCRFQLFLLFSTSQKFGHTFPFPWMRKCVQTFEISSLNCQSVH